MPSIDTYPLAHFENQRPILIIGAGGIVRDAHLPAYKKAGFSIFGIVDIVKDRADMLAKQYQIPNVFSNVSEAVTQAPANTVYDMALNPDQQLGILKMLPDHSSVLLQKPFGTSLEAAKVLAKVCNEKKLTAAVNFQLRFAPFVEAARQLINSGVAGEIYDMEVRLTTHTPWQNFPALATEDRLEILYHSIHYLDLIRSFFGEPESVFARSFGHPSKPFSSTRSTILLDYGKHLRAVINTNHDHDFGPEHQESFIKWEGTKGAIKGRIGVLLDYPTGLPDALEYCTFDENGKPEWKNHDLTGNWFPDAFIKTMSQFINFSGGADDKLESTIDDALKTMELVEKCFR